jgi:hypothetical protein
MTKSTMYTTRLQAGLGLIQETRVLLELWQPGMDARGLQVSALHSGQFPNVSARRLRNVVAEGFAPRYLTDKSLPALLLKQFLPLLSQAEFEQLLFVYTCRANPILGDFTRDVYWPAYCASHGSLSNEQARNFVADAQHNGKTNKPWSDTTIRRVAGYLTGCLADFGLLEPGRKSSRRFLPYHPHARSLTLLAYEMHFTGWGDNQILSHPDWGLLGQERADMLEQFKRLSLKGWVIYQSAGGATRISWPCNSMEDLQRVLA